MRLITTYDTVIAINEPHKLPDDFNSHGHEEADTQIPLHVLNCIKNSAYRHIVVESLDTDVLILLMDLVACGHLGTLTSLEFHTGKGKKFHKIDVVERVNSIGVRRSRGLIGLHNFTGTDWGGRFVGVSKKRWTLEYLKLDPDDPIIDAFIRLGPDTLTASELVHGKLPEPVQPLEHFVCLVYKLNRGPYLLPQARWELFKTRNLESEMLPPTRGTLLPHIQRTSFCVQYVISITLMHLVKKKMLLIFIKNFISNFSNYLENTTLWFCRVTVHPGTSKLMRWINVNELNVAQMVIHAPDRNLTIL